MADLILSFAMTPYDRVLPLISGEVNRPGVPGVSTTLDQIFFQKKC
jgi:hypothetical protein